MAVSEIKYCDKIYKISYNIANWQNTHSIVILHGWGANKEIMEKAFLPHLSNFRQIYIDMPGFGKSTFETPLYTRDYANIIYLFLKAINIEPTIVMGHSFGGKVATLLNPKILVLLSSAGIINAKSPLVRAKIAIFKFFKILGFGKLYRLFASKDVAGMSRAMYETFKNVVDENFANEFQKFSGKALIFWGKDDKQTPLKNGEKIADLIKDSQFFAVDGDHFFFLLHAKFIAEKIGENSE